MQIMKETVLYLELLELAKDFELKNDCHKLMMDTYSGSVVKTKI